MSIGPGRGLDYNGVFPLFWRTRVLEAVTTLLLAVHLAAMNVASAAPLAGAWLRRLASREAPGESGWLERGARRVFAWSLAALTIGALVGGAMLISPSAGMRAALARFPENAYWYAGAEILFSAACIAGCWKLARWPKTTWLLALATSTNLLYHFPPLMAVLGELAADSDWADAELITRAVLRQLWMRPEVLSLWIHVTLASIALGFTAAIVAVSSHTAQPTGDVNQFEPLTNRLTRQFAGTALAATLLQIPVGIWLLLVSDDAAQQSMMGDDWLATVGLAGGVWVALGVIQSLAALAWGGYDRRQLHRCCVLLALTVLLMSMTLRVSRRAGVPAVGDAAAAASATVETPRSLHLVDRTPMSQFSPWLRRGVVCHAGRRRAA